MIRFVKYRLPVYYTIILCFGVSALMYLLLNGKAEMRERDGDTTGFLQNSSNEQINIQRLKGFDYISPLMFVETNNKAARFDMLAQKISAYFNLKKQSGDIAGGAFYFKDTKTAEWTGYNEAEKYNPGSLMKVPELISILRLEEEHPGTLAKQIFYTTPFVTEKRTRFISKQLEAGKSYSIKQLLYYMIAHSDNNATLLLDQNLDQRIFNKTLTDLGLPAPEKDALNYPLSAKDFSLFMRAIYNASYLTIPHSEYAAELLSASDFKEGFVKGFPAGVKMIHKFGEAGNLQERQLHESCIVYVNEHPYVLTVMTKGADMLNLSAALSDVASIVYQQVATAP